MTEPWLQNSETCMASIIKTNLWSCFLLGLFNDWSMKFKEVAKSCWKWRKITHLWHCTFKWKLHIVCAHGKCAEIVLFSMQAAEFVEYQVVFKRLNWYIFPVCKFMYNCLKLEKSLWQSLSGILYVLNPNNVFLHFFRWWYSSTLMIRMYFKSFIPRCWLRGWYNITQQVMMRRPAWFQSSRWEWPGRYIHDRKSINSRILVSFKLPKVRKTTRKM